MDELIERIRKHIDEVGECWEWTGSQQSHAPTPMMNWKGRVRCVRRVIAEHKGLVVNSKLLATCSRRNELCVNPDHIVMITRRKLATLVVDETGFQKDLVRKKKLADKARARAKLTMEQVEQIRAADGLQKDIAALFGVTQPTISAIKRGAIWRDYSNPWKGLIK